ncbi:MAG: hypothetical protein Q9216_004381 [Gyalolechia sp. 2 TL-2023]
MKSDDKTHSHLALDHFSAYFDHARRKEIAATVDGPPYLYLLTNAYQTQRHGAALRFGETSVRAVSDSARVLQDDISGGRIIYGVNTGFGGSADTRTEQIEELQDVLVRELQSGILTTPPNPDISGQGLGKARETLDDTSPAGTPLSNSLAGSNDGTCMPETWVKAAMLIRTNSLASGYSGVRPVLIQNMISLIQNDVIPRVPLRGSISASGDLMPLSYIGGLLQGRRRLFTMIGDRSLGQRRATNAEEALKSVALEPLRLAPKEGLAIVNGTSFSAGLAALVTHDANGLAVLAQVLTAMSVEALCGTAESFDPMFANVRPHPGQIESSFNIRSFLHDSKLVNHDRGLEEGSLRQDRYSLRTAAQWLGPVLEDLQLAFQQVTIECNSVTDNPLVDVSNARMLHGGNFQAMAITSAMEKTKLSLQIIGQMLYAQCTEMINPKTNYGLPPNLVAEDPSASFLMKPVDIMIAAFQSELGFLANPVGTHVQSAEMGNQALNSLALISARYCFETVDVLSHLVSAHLFAVCQALDLRAMHIRYLETLKPAFADLTTAHLAPIMEEDSDAAITALQNRLWAAFLKLLDQTTTLDPTQRFPFIVQSLQPIVLSAASARAETVTALRSWTEHCTKTASETFSRNREIYASHPDATGVVGVASRRIYTFIRQELGVPFIRSTKAMPTDTNGDGVAVETVNVNGHTASTSTSASTPTSTTPSTKQSSKPSNAVVPENMTVGSYITIIYIAIRDGSLYEPAVLGCLAEARSVPVMTTTAAATNNHAAPDVELEKVDLSMSQGESIL